MYYTEKEARKKWCPHVRFADTAEDGLYTTRGEVMNFSKMCCIASGCMMWQWHQQVKCAPEDVMQARSIGCCGLVGR